MTAEGAPDKAVAAAEERTYERETRIRDEYANRLKEYRPAEQLLKTEWRFEEANLRVDMRTLDAQDTIRVWEFKIVAGYDGLGQILTYVALARSETGFERRIRGVLAAFEFQPEVEAAIEIMNLGVEIVRIPSQLRLAGDIPPPDTPVVAPQIPVIRPPIE